MQVTDPPVEETAEAGSSPGRKRTWLFVVVVACVTVTGIVFSVGFGRDPTVVDSVLLNDVAPPLMGPTLDGGSFDLSDHRGKIAVINVWASWCGPCRREHPLLAEAAERLQPLGVVFVGINTQDTDAEAERFLDDLGGENYPSVTDPKGRLAVEWGTFGVPETFVVDRNGRVHAKRIGELTPGWIETTVAPLLEQQ